MSVCTGCGGPSIGRARCRACTMDRENFGATVAQPLPPRLPEPPSIRFCGSCGALQALHTDHGVSKCIECWRRAA